MMPLVDAWRLEHARQERDEALARALKAEEELGRIEATNLVVDASWKASALKYEQALREIENTAINFSKGTIDSMMLIGMRMIEATARAALDKPGTEVEAVGAAPGWTVTVGYEEKT